MRFFPFRNVILSWFDENWIQMLLADSAVSNMSWLCQTLKIAFSFRLQLSPCRNSMIASTNSIATFIDIGHKISRASVEMMLCSQWLYKDMIEMFSMTVLGYDAKVAVASATNSVSQTDLANSALKHSAHLQPSQLYHREISQRECCGNICNTRILVAAQIRWFEF